MIQESEPEDILLSPLTLATPLTLILLMKPLPLAIESDVILDIGPGLMTGAWCNCQIVALVCRYTFPRWCYVLFVHSVCLLHGSSCLALPYIIIAITQGNTNTVVIVGLLLAAIFSHFYTKLLFLPNNCRKRETGWVTWKWWMMIFVLVGKQRFDHHLI